VSVRTFDHDGKSWTADRIGRTSGIVAPNREDQSIPGPADIVRFVCASDPDEDDRETTVAPGLLSGSTDDQLVAILQSARRVTRPKTP
jgi:hypothetical protein